MNFSPEPQQVSYLREDRVWVGFSRSKTNTYIWFNNHLGCCSPVYPRSKGFPVPLYMLTQGLHACPLASLDSTSQLLQYTLMFQGICGSMCECVLYAGTTAAAAALGNLTQ